MPRFKATITFEYDADPKNYYMRGLTPTVADMLRIDKENFEGDPALLYGHEFSVSVEVL